MDVKEVMRKIAKLKKLYEGAKAINSEGEANAAAAAMRRLLNEYNLSLDEVQSEVEKDENPMMHERISGNDWPSVGGRWQMKLSHVICEYNFCKSYTVGSSYQKLIIVGRKENLETVKWLLDMLKERFHAFSKIRYREMAKSCPNWQRVPCSDTWQRSYLMGCVDGLEAKLKAEREREQREEVELSTKITALTIRNNAAVDKYVEKTWGGVKNGRNWTKKSDSAHAAGYKDGLRTSINKPIEGRRAAAESQKLLG